MHLLYFESYLFIVCLNSIWEAIKIFFNWNWIEHRENVSNCSLYQVPPTLKLSWKSIQPFFRNVPNRETDRQTDRQTNGQRWKHNLRHGGGNNNLCCTQSNANATLQWWNIGTSSVPCRVQRIRIWICRIGPHKFGVTSQVRLWKLGVDRFVHITG